MYSLNAFERFFPRLSIPLNFWFRRCGHFAPPPHTRAKVAEAATRVRVKRRVFSFLRFFPNNIDTTPWVFYSTHDSSCLSRSYFNSTHDTSNFRKHWFESTRDSNGFSRKWFRFNSRLKRLPKISIQLMTEAKSMCFWVDSWFNFESCPCQLKNNVFCRLTCPRMVKMWHKVVKTGMAGSRISQIFRSFLLRSYIAIGRRMS